jgi:hypothetical protein
LIENTERPVTVEQGTNYLEGTDPAAGRIADGVRTVWRILKYY